MSDFSRTSTEGIARSITMETTHPAKERNDELTIGNLKGKTTTIKLALTTSGVANFLVHVLVVWDRKGLGPGSPKG